MSLTKNTMPFAAVFLMLFGFASNAAAQCSLNSNYDGVQLQAGNPFQAEKVNSMTPEPQGKLVRTLVPPASIARDSQGRVRIEMSAGKFKVEEGAGSGTEAERHVVRICDPITQKLVTLDSVSKTATIRSPIQGSLRPKAATQSSFCSTFARTHGLGATQVEDLGRQSIEGIDAQGIRTTRSMPAIHNGESTTIPSVTEVWCSDDLGALVLQVRQSGSVDRKLETKLTNISRGEPDPTLFQIPPDYRVVEEVPEEGKSGQLGTTGTIAAPTQPALPEPNPN
jgi:hypothetical protein